MSVPNATPCLFLSHSGADTDAARELKRRLLDSPDARAAGLRVWFDKDDLAAGVGWQAQLERAISEEATAFAVHVGAKGVLNWVESEVRLGLSRATGAPDFPFIPVLAKECSGSGALPHFARQYQGVHDPLNEPEEFAKLLRAVLRRSPDQQTVALKSPFVGLKAMTEADADRFFGRNEEIAGLVALLKQHRLIAIVADSGAGKSSLAQAGLIPAFRGGALSDTAGREPDDRLWHVVVIRPRRDPIEGLRRGVTEAAERLGRSADQCAGLRKRIGTQDPSETAYAIRCDLPVGRTETLLIVDQFEELLTETGEAQRGPFIDLLIALEAVGGFWVMLILRADHFNLCRPFSELFEHLTRNGHEAVLRLRRITDKGIDEAVRNPLCLAGHRDVSEQDAVIESIRRDITDRAGDLALVQMALYAMWQKHRTDGVNLLVAYSQVGGVVGALAHEAEQVRTHRLDASERASLAPLFIRLVRLGEIGGATRRAADLADFDRPRRVLAAKLATEDCGRLLLAGEKTVEIAHEALITQWPWLQNTVNEAATDMRVLDRLMDKARRWNTTESRPGEHLATGAERAEFASLAERRPDWLSTVEQDFVAASEEAERARRALPQSLILEALMVVPRDFREDLDRAQKAGLAGDLRLLAEEARGFDWGNAALRLVGEAQFGIRALAGAKETFDALRRLDPDDLQANYRLGTIYRNLAESAINVETKLDHITRSEQAIARVLEYTKPPADHDESPKEAAERHYNRAEVYSLLGSNAKTRWLEQWKSTEAADARGTIALRSPHLADSIQNYLTGFAEDLDSFYPGINGLAMLRIQLGLAKSLPAVWTESFEDEEKAEAARQECERRVDRIAAALYLALGMDSVVTRKDEKRDIWKEISRADLLFLTLGRPSQVARAYRNALMTASPFHVDAARRNVLLFRDLGLLPANVKAALNEMPQAAPQAAPLKPQPPARVVLFTGHMLDSPARPADKARFPRTPEAEEIARHMIEEALRNEMNEEDGVSLGIAGGACGSDILFHEVCESLGIPTRLYLALPEAEFQVESVNRGGPVWAQRYRKLCQRLPLRVLAESKELPRWLAGKYDYDIWRRNNLWMMFNVLATDARHITLIALYNHERDPDGPDGTEHLVNVASKWGFKTVVLDARELLKSW